MTQGKNCPHTYADLVRSLFAPPVLVTFVVTMITLEEERLILAHSFRGLQFTRVGCGRHGIHSRRMCSRGTSHCTDQEVDRVTNCRQKCSKHTSAKTPALTLAGKHPGAQGASPCTSLQTCRKINLRYKMENDVNTNDLPLPEILKTCF